MIITLTPNPSVDQTIWVDRLQPGTVHRPLATDINPAGKGINVSRMAHRLGWPTIAFGVLAGETGNIVEKALEAERVQHHFVRAPGQTRINVTVVDKTTSAATSFYGPGPIVEPDPLSALDALLRFWLQAGRVLVLAGSLAPGLPEQTYATYIHAAREEGVRTILDADGAALRLGIAAAPDLIKPNVAEAERLLGRTLPDLPAVARAARELADGGVGTVIISMAEHGAICVQGDQTWLVHAPHVERRSTVGSGDSMVAGLAISLARGEGIERGLQLGTAAGAATAATAGTALGTADEVMALLPHVRIEEWA